MVVLQIIANGQLLAQAPITLGMRVETQVVNLPDPPQVAPAAAPVGDKPTEAKAAKKPEEPAAG